MPLSSKAPKAKQIQIAIASLAVVGIGVWLVIASVIRTRSDLQQLQKNPTEGAKREFDASLESTKALVAGIGTIATISGGVFLYLNYKQAQDRLITERFSKAVEQLGSEKMEVRIGAIYSLERIAKDSPNDHWTVVEVLTAFIRERSPAKKEPDSTKPDAMPWHLQPVTADIQAALTVIGRREITQDPENKVINLSQTKLFRADLSHCKLAHANLSAAFMRGANLTKAILTEANLLGSNLFQADLTEAELSGANLGFADIKAATNLKSPIGLTEHHFRNAKLCRTEMPDGTICDRDCLSEFSYIPPTSAETPDEMENDRDC